MVNLTINNQKVKVPEETTILEAARIAGIEIPHLCYLKDINEIGACRVCVVEIEGMDELVSSCNTYCREGMNVFTNSPRARSCRRYNMEFILSNHKSQCTTCVRSGNCALQKAANDLSIIDSPFPIQYEETPWDMESPLIRDASKCIRCMRCIQVCDKIQGMGVWGLTGTGGRTTVGVRGNESIKDTNCVYCGQCITHCPVGALRERNDIYKLYRALSDPEVTTVVQVAPAVRVAWGEGVGLHSSESTTGKMVSALREIGFDYIYDTVYSADLTIMEEGSEFVERYNHKEDYSWPMFTSCCPGWVRFAKGEFPDFVDNLSTAKSPQQMFGSVIKTYAAQKQGLNPDKIFSVSIMPCVSKKYECDVDQVNDSGHGQDVDLVITTRELDRLIKADRIQVEALGESNFDEIFGQGTGAGVIFGATGGVMEAALRTAYNIITGENPPVESFSRVRGMDGWKEAVFEIQGMEIRTAVANGLANTRKLMEAIKSGEVEYDFVEVMACPGGCAGGGGQPIHEGRELAESRGKSLYGIDKNSKIRFSHENPSVQLTYDEYLEKPNSHIAHNLLHTNLKEWDM